LIKAAKIGMEIVKRLIVVFGLSKHQLTNRFTTLNLALNKSNPLLRLCLIEGKINVDAFIRMQEKDLANDE
jgi:hypothetical protein